MSFKKLLKYTRRGAVLPLVVLIVLLMLVIGLSVNSLGMHSRFFSIRTESKISARSAADSAINDAIFEMNKKLKVIPWNSTLPVKTDVPLQDTMASFDYTVTEDEDIYSVQATGRCNSSVHTVNSVLRLYSPFDYALLSRGDIEMKNTGSVQWYNNKPGDWPAKIGTLSTSPSAVVLKAGSIVNGDIMVGVGGNPDTVVTTKSAVTVTGGMYPLTYEPELPPVIVPEFVALPATKGIIQTSMDINTSGKYTRINLGLNEKIRILGPVTLYVTDDISMGNSAEFIIGGPNDINNNASLTLYVGKNISAGNSAGFTNLTKDARRLKLFCLPDCTSILLKNQSNFYGVIYAPNSDIVLDNQADVYGSIIGNSFILKNTGTFFYDANLRDRSIYDELVRFTIDRWSEE